MNKQKEENLPQGWAKTTLGEVCLKIVDGSHNPPPKKNDGIPMLSARNIENGRIEFSNFRYISLEEFEIENARTRIAPDDVLLTIVGTIGRAAVVPESTSPFALQRSVAVLKPIRILSKFLMYQFQSNNFQNILADSAKGTAQKGIYLKKLSQLPFIIAPLPEQKRIVDEIEKQFSRLDETIKLFKRTQKNVQKMRASTFKWACEGKLVPIEAEAARRENREYESADKLLKRILQLRRAKWEADQLVKMQEAGKSLDDDKWKLKYVEPDAPNIIDLPILPEGWIWTRLEQICYLITDGTHFKPDYTETGVPFLSVKNVRPGIIKDDEIKYISPEQHSQYIKRNKPEKGDILYTKIGATFGYAAVNNLPYEFSIYVSLALLKFPQELILPEYFELCLNSEIMYQQAQQRIKGVGRPDLHLEEIRDFYFPLPPIDEQNRIVEENERRVSVINKLEAVIKTNMQRAESLRRKILQDAFEGKLAEQNPNDEPASILLEKIKIERERRETELSEERRKKPQTMKQNKIKRRDIIEVLKESKTEMTPEQLFNAAGFNPDEVEEFYAELKKADNEENINQEKKDNGSVYLTAKV